MKLYFLIFVLVISGQLKSQTTLNAYKLVWSDEFNKDGLLDSTKWKYETGFVRNQEIQWYQKENAICKDGNLVITGKKERKS